VAGILFIISAPSGSGKSTLVNHLRSMVDKLDFSVSYTTRAPRGQEQDGREYHYISVPEFERMIAADEFLEYADVFGNYYGTARRSLTDATARGRDLLLDIDVQGATQVRAKVPDAVSIFILPPTPAVLEARLRNRSAAEGAMDDAVIERRLKKARHEIENYRQYSYILVNDVLELAIAQLHAIVVTERLRLENAPGHVLSGLLAQASDSVQQPDAEQWQKLHALAAECRQPMADERVHPVLAAFGFVGV
jgi:guanylate kinase